MSPDDVGGGRCAHARYRSKLRVENVAVGGIEVRQLLVRVSVACAACGEPFVWKGPVGFSTSAPMVSPDGSELRAPIDYPIEPDEEAGGEDEKTPTLH